MDFFDLIRAQFNRFCRKWFKIPIRICLLFLIEIRDDYEFFWNSAQGPFNRITLITTNTSGSGRVAAASRLLNKFSYLYLLPVIHKNSFWVFEILTKLILNSSKCVWNWHWFQEVINLGKVLNAPWSKKSIT